MWAGQNVAAYPDHSGHFASERITMLVAGTVDCSRAVVVTVVEVVGVACGASEVPTTTAPVVLVTAAADVVGSSASCS